MNPIRVIESRTVVLPRENIDTDQIIPARFLKVTDKAGLGKAAFADWRYGPDGAPLPDFVLNRPEAPGCADPGGRRQLRLRLLARARALGAARLRLPRRRLHPRSPTSSRSNALKNGLLPIVVDAASHAALLAAPGADGRASTSRRRR